MIRATISDLKDRLSAYLRRVKAGESILVLERRTPVARIVPLARAAEDTKSMDDTHEDAKPARLEHAGVVVRRRSGSPLEVLGPPLRTDAGLLEALLEERSEERHKGGR